MALTVIGSGGGIPVDTPTIETGSYVGTGTHGSANPCSITFNGTPVFVLVSGNRNKALFDPLGMVSGYSSYWFDSLGAVQASTNTHAEMNGKTLSWYNTNSSGAANYQMNKSGTTYYWFAITI